MKLQIENNSSSNFMDNQDLSSDVRSSSGSAEVTEMLRKGIKAAQDGNRAEARHLLMQATELEPKNENAWLWLASISEYPEELLIFLSNVLGINPTNERALEWEKSTKALLSKTFVQRGIEASKESQGAFAKQCFLQAIVHDDKNEMAWLWLASISTIIEEKKSHLQKVLNINPNNETALALLKSVKTEMAQTLLKKAQAEVISGTYDSAAKMISEILNYAPELEEAWMLKSYLTDSFSEKMSYFEKVLEINPKNEDAASCLEGMRSVLSRTEPKLEAEEVKDLEVSEKIAKPEEALDMLDLNITGELKPIEMQNESFDKVEVVESDSDAETEVEEDFSDSPTQDFKFTEDSTETVENAEENSPQQIESVEETVKMEEEVFESSPEEEEAETNQAFADVAETEENVFEEIQHNVEEVEETAEEMQPVGEIPSYEEVIEEAQTFEEEQKAEEFAAENQPVETVEETVEMVETVEETAETVEETVETVETVEEFSAAPTEEVFEQEVFEQEVSEQEVQEQMASSESETTAETEQSEVAAQVEEEPKKAEKAKAVMVSCVFCEAENEQQAFVCHSCHAILTLSDLEMLLANQDVDLMSVQQKVEQMEIDNSISKFDVEGLKMLGIGLINLKNFRKGFEYLQEAAHLNPNDVLLNGQVNALAIRLAEIEEKNHEHDSMPKNKTILVVDDSATVRKLISAKLEKCGHEVISAVDGMDALEKINEVIPDLILLDITMPRMDGYQVCKLIRGNDATKDVPVVMISGKDGFFDKVRGRMAGTTGYITKPFGPETLMKTVETYIN